ncbi:MAG: hypothetical protein L0170_08855 [Acidobacteria bacterium]|nr:hypothetical protein [Acidobacteriota bacterium]
MGALDPSVIHRQTVQQLQEVFLRMNSPEWDLALKEKPENVVRAAARQLLAVQRARLGLENAELADIQAKLAANEEALEQGRIEVRNALQKLAQIEAVLESVASFLGVVSRVVSLA